MRKREADPGKDLRWQPWCDIFAQLFCQAKKGATGLSLIAQGCRMASYKYCYTCIVWPVIGPDLIVDTPIGFIVMDYQARMLDVRDKEGKVVNRVPKKATFGSRSGLIGVDAIAKLKTPDKVDTVWKVEGITDQAALWAAIPEELRDRHVVITTSNGCGDSPDWRGDLLAQCNVNIIHDCDEPGQRSALKWANYIAQRQGPGKITKNITLPFEVLPDHGMDLRDYLNGESV